MTVGDPPEVDPDEVITRYARWARSDLNVVLDLIVSQCRDVPPEVFDAFEDAVDYLGQYVIGVTGNIRSE